MQAHETVGITGFYHLKSRERVDTSMGYSDAPIATGDLWEAINGR